MTFKSLKIEVEDYGPNKGKLVSELSISGHGAKTTLILPDIIAE